MYPSDPQREKVMTMVALLLPSVESCGGGHATFSREGEACPSSPKEERVMAMVTFLPSSVESCAGGHGQCHHFLEETGPALLVQGKERVMTMALFLRPWVKSCGGGH